MSFSFNKCSFWDFLNVFSWHKIPHAMHKSTAKQHTSHYPAVIMCLTTWFQRWDKGSLTMIHIYPAVHHSDHLREVKRIKPSWEYSWSSGSSPERTSGIISDRLCSLAFLPLIQLQNRNEFILLESPYHAHRDLYDQLKKIKSSLQCWQKQNLWRRADSKRTLKRERNNVW